MKKVLHILKQNNRAPLAYISQRAHEVEVEIILIQDAVNLRLDEMTVFVLADDLTGKTDYLMLSYKEFLEKIFCSDTVVTW